MMDEMSVATVKTDPITHQTYEGLRDLDWVGIPGFAYVMKYRFDEDGYILLISNLVSVYGEKLYGMSLQERFQTQNPYAEMLPKVILKHVKQSIQKLLAGEQAEPKINHNAKKITMQLEFNMSEVKFVFDCQPHILSDMQFKVHILQPILLRALEVDEERSALQKKIKELDGKESSSSSGIVEKMKIQDVYSKLKDNDCCGFILSFLYLQNKKIAVPESLRGCTSPTKKLSLPSKHMETLKPEITYSIPLKVDPIDEEDKNNSERILPAKREADDLDIDEEKSLLPIKNEPKVSPSKKKKLIKF